MAIVNCGLSQEYVVKIESTEECEEDNYINGSEICPSCLLSFPTPFEEKTHLMQLFYNLTNIDVEAEANNLKRNTILCNKCINKVEMISLFVSLSLCNNIKLGNIFERNKAMKTEDCLEENSNVIGTLKCNMKFESNLGKNEVIAENNSDENALCYERKDLHIVVEIKKEDFNSSEESIGNNCQNGLESCSEFNSVEQLYVEYDPCENEFSTENYQKIISKGLEDNLDAQFIAKKLRCDICEKRFTQKSALNVHSLTHTGVKSFNCDICEKSFTRKISLTRHLFTHTGKKPFKCDICEKGFTQKMVLRRHLLTHTGEKPFKCEYCAKGFAYRDKLKGHSFTHTGENPYKCDICEKSFTQKNPFNRHLLTHTGQKPFKCDICKKSFSSKWKVKVHLRIHTGEKPFKCDVCEKGFSSKWHSQQHMHTHTEEKPFKCDFCEKSFRQKHKLKCHLQTHTETKLVK